MVVFLQVRGLPTGKGVKGKPGGILAGHRCSPGARARSDQDLPVLGKGECNLGRRVHLRSWHRPSKNGARTIYGSEASGLAVRPFRGS